jgi:hemerythrin superfamily protein
MPSPMEQLAAKSAGIAGAIAARVKGLNGVFSRLAEQHREASVLLKRLATVDEVNKRQDLWSTVRRELLSHERAELTTVYPVLAQHAATRDIVQRHAQDADTLDEAIGEIDLVGCDAPTFKPLIERLITHLTQHVTEEENEFFPRAQQALGRERVEELEAPFLAARERIMGNIS